MKHGNIFIFFIVSICFASVGCISTKRERDLQARVFDTQARLMKLENILGDGSKTQQVGHQLASTESRFERLEKDLRVLRGEQDRLRVGVLTGQMPGEAASEAVSVAERIALLEQRFADMEMLLEEIKGQKSSNNFSQKSSQKNQKESFASLQEAFDAKQYKKVVSSAPGLLKSAKGDEKQKLSYIYAESLFQQKDYRNAALAYDTYVNINPNKADQGSALLRLGDCFRNIGDKATAKIYYQEIIEKFPNSEYANAAKGIIKDKL